MSISDHDLVFCVIKAGIPKIPPRVCEVRSYKNYDKGAFVNDLKNVPWNIIDSVEDVDDAVFLWERMFNDVADAHAPIRKKRLKGRKTPWITPKLLEIRRERDYYLKKSRQTNSSYHWGMYRKLRNHVNREEKRLKSEHFCNLINETKSDSSSMGFFKESFA